MDQQKNTNLFTPPSLRLILKVFGVIIVSFTLYYLTALCGLEFATLNKHASPVWPATGIAFGLFYLLGPFAVIGIYIGAVAANYTVGTPLLICLLISIGNSLEVVIGMALYRYLMNKKNEFGIHSKSIFGVFSLAIGAGVSATTATVVLLLFGVTGNDLVIQNWSTWWIGDVLGGLFLLPFIYKISVSEFNLLKSIDKKYFHFSALLFLTLGLNYFIFSTPLGAPYLFLIFLPLLHAALWFDTLLIFLISFITFVWAITGTVLGFGPFTTSILNESLIHLQLFLLGLGLTSLGLAELKEANFNHRIVTTLIFGWILSGATFFSFFNSNQEIDQNRFAMKAEQAQQAIESRISDYTTLLESNVGFFDASELASQSSWRTFTKKLLLNREFQNVEGVGVIYPSPNQNEEDFFRFNKIKEKIPDFKIHSPPISSPNFLIENPESHLIVTYIEPFNEKNKKALGIDISLEKNRAEAAYRARDSGLPAMTGKILLVQNKILGGAGFLLFIPFYKRGLALSNRAERRKAFLGLVYSPIIVDKFFSSILDKFSNDLHLEAFANDNQKPRSRIYSSPIPAIQSENKITNSSSMAGQKINFVWRKAQTFESASGLLFSLMSFFGATISLLLALMLSSLQSLTVKAQAIAEEKTKEVIEKNAIWKKLTETSPIGIYLTDKNGRCTYVNNSWSQLTGLSLEQALGDGWIQAIHEDDLPFVLENWQKLATGGKFDFNYRLKNIKNEVFHISGQAVALQNESNEVTGYLGITQDLTDSVKKSHALMAAARLSSLGEMASGIAHEINNPLSIILGKSFLLQSLIETENFDIGKAKKFTLQISETVHRISKIIRGLRSFARETAGEPFEKNDVYEVVQETLELCRERFSGHAINLTVSKVLSPNTLFWGRSEQMAQVLLNLLNNAFDASADSAEKWVKVDFSVTPKKIQIKISNSGVLIPESEKIKIFDPFYTTKEVGKGTGLGLSISKGIIESHGGKLYLESQEKWTTFIVEIDQYFDPELQLT